MKNLILILLFLPIHIFAESQLRDLMKQELSACMNSENAAHKIYDTIKNKNFEDSSELSKIISYRSALLEFYEDCYKTYAYRKDAQQAQSLAKELDSVIDKLKKK